MSNNINEHTAFITKHLAVEFVKKQDEFIMKNIIQHLSTNEEEYALITISKEHLYRIVQLGLQAFQEEQRLRMNCNQEVDNETN